MTWSSLKLSSFSLDGAMKIGAAGFQEMRNALFSYVSHNSMQKMSGQVFEHLHHSDKSFFLDKSAKGLCDDVSKGTK